MRAVLLLLLSLGGLAVAGDDPDPVAVLMRLRDRVLEQGERVPNHVCVETVVRDYYSQTGGAGGRSCDTIAARRQGSGALSRLRLDTTDRLRLDVAFAGDREINSWAGASKFEEGEIDELIPEGAMGTGTFASFLLSIFLGRPPRFVFEGDQEEAGRSLLEYSFHVPVEESRYRHKVQHEWLPAGYTGVLLVDSATADLVRLTVRTEEMPPASGICEVETRMDYGKVRLKGSDFLLPQSTNQRFIGRDGSESENRYSYTDCHDFLAESSIRFGDHTGGNPSTPAADAAPKWPAGISLRIDLESNIDSSSAAAGDRIKGRLAAAIRDGERNILAPEGAAATGRLMRMEIRHAPTAEVTIALRWETLEVDGHAVPLALVPNWKVKLPEKSTASGPKRRGIEIELPRVGEERFGVFHFPGEEQVIQKGLRTEWFTDKL